MIRDANVLVRGKMRVRSRAILHCLARGLLGGRLVPTRGPSASSVHWSALPASVCPSVCTGRLASVCPSVCTGRLASVCLLLPTGPLRFGWFWPQARFWRNCTCRETSHARMKPCVELIFGGAFVQFHHCIVPSITHLQVGAVPEIEAHCLLWPT
jgi:hypothetical protein